MPTPTVPTSTLLTRDELAEYLKVPVTTLDSWQRRRTLPPSVKLGRAVRYRLADVDAWIEEQATRD